jgi:alpha-tubulin suppressor-like RCC1 family protein
LVGAGYQHSAGLDREGGLWVWTNKSSLSWASSVPKHVQGLPPLFNVACGEDFIVMEAEEGLWVLGNNESGQLGLGHTETALIPSLVPIFDRSKGPLRCLLAANRGIVLIDSEGSLWTTGQSCVGDADQLGKSNTFQRVPDVPPMIRGSCGREHTHSLDESGGVWTWGRGYFGQTGTGITSHISQATFVASLEGVIAITAGRYHSLAFLSDGGMLVFGSNRFGQLGLTHKKDENYPILSEVRPLPPHVAPSRQKSARF